MSDYRRIGEILLEKGKVTQEQLDTAVACRKGQRRRLGRILTTLGFVTEKDIAICLAEQYGLDVIDPSGVAPDQTALALLGGDLALRCRVLPVRFSAESLECVIADPVDFPTTDMIARMAGRRTVFHIAPESDLVESIKNAYNVARVRSETSSDRPAAIRESGARRATDRETILARLDAMAGRGV